MLSSIFPALPLPAAEHMAGLCGGLPRLLRLMARAARPHGHITAMVRPLSL